jgi:glycosyltransferase involved in cell wall biosynthesis
VSGLGEPIISVVVPLYNKQEYIHRCLQSILNQTITNFEILVIDDGSTDGGPEVVRGFSDRRLRLITQVNGGPGAARNRGIAEAKAKWIAFLDGDDEWSPEFLAAIQNLSILHPQAAVLATGYRRLLDTGHVREVNLSSGSGRNTYLIQDYFRLARTSEFVTCSSVAVRKDVLDEVGGFLERARFGEDLDLWARIAAQYPIACDSRVLAIYHSEAAGRSFDLAGTDAPYPAIVERLRKLARDPHVDEHKAREIEALADLRLIQYAYWLVSLRQRSKLLQFLRAERFSTPRYRSEARMLRILLSAVPMRVIEAVKVRSGRLMNSRVFEFCNAATRRGTVAVRVRTVKTGL